MTLADHIHQLTAEHMTMTETGEFTKAAPLLAQLRAACTSDFAVSRGGSGGAGMLLNSKAVKLENEIKAQALNEQFEMTGVEYYGNLVALIRSWAAVKSEEWQGYLEHISLEWIDAIRETLEAKRPPWRPSLPCPACGQRFYGPERDPCLAVHYWDHDTDTIAPPGTWTAECEGCGAAWNGGNLKWLRAAADTPTLEVAHVG
jgi:hypothetical protein